MLSSLINHAEFDELICGLDVARAQGIVILPRLQSPLPSVDAAHAPTPQSGTSFAPKFCTKPADVLDPSTGPYQSQVPAEALMVEIREDGMLDPNKRPGRSC